MLEGKAGQLEIHICGSKCGASYLRYKKVGEGNMSLWVVFSFLLLFSVGPQPKRGHHSHSGKVFPAYALKGH